MEQNLHLSNGDSTSSGPIAEDSPLLTQIRGVSPECLDTANWPTIDEANLPDKTRKAYLARKRAVNLLLRGSSAQTIKSRTGITIDYIRRLIRQCCVRTHPDGRLWGWRGLVPWTHCRRAFKTTQECALNFTQGH